MRLLRASKTVYCEGCGEPIRKGEIIVESLTSLSHPRRRGGWWDCIHCSPYAPVLWLRAYMDEWEMVNATRNR